MNTKANLLKTLIREEVRKQLKSRRLNEGYFERIGLDLFAEKLFDSTYGGNIDDLGELLRKRDKLAEMLIDRYGKDPIIKGWNIPVWWSDQYEEFLTAGDEASMQMFVTAETRAQRIFRAALNQINRENIKGLPYLTDLEQIVELNKKILAWWKNQRFRKDDQSLNSGRTQITVLSAG